MVVGCLDLIVLGCVLKWLLGGCWLFGPDSFGLCTEMFAWWLLAVCGCWLFVVVGCLWLLAVWTL